MKTVVAVGVRVVAAVLFGAALVAVIAQPKTPEAAQNPSKGTAAAQQQPMQAQPAGVPVPGLGVMVHYLPDKQSIREVMRFDVESFANQLAEMRVSHLILTLGQNNGQYIAPNSALEVLCPASAKTRSPRDLPLEIGQALRSRGIAMILYLPFRAPQSDRYLMDCLGDVNEQQPPPARRWRHAARPGGCVRGAPGTSRAGRRRWTRCPRRSRSPRRARGARECPTAAAARPTWPPRPPKG